jgi:protein-S-isoprenylcysteine O-methyltransferase Ste14
MSVAGSGTPLPLDTARKLVVSGPYRYVRNPMAVAGLAQGACVGIILGSFGTLIYVLAGMIVWNYFVRPAEEADLALRFGEAYADYCKKTKCWIPNFPGYRLKKDN